MRLGARGDGMARLGHVRVFVPFTLPGERVEARIVGTAPDGLLARAERWIAESPERGAAPVGDAGLVRLRLTPTRVCGCLAGGRRRG